MSENIVIGDVRPRTQSVGDGTLVEFFYTFPIFKQEDLEVYLDETLQSSGYAVTGAGDSDGGSVTFDTPPLNGVIVTLRRRLAIERLSDFAEGGAFHAKVINQELDYLVAVTQQNEDDILRSLTLHPADEDASLQLPSKEARANRSLGFDAAGSPVAGPNVTEIANAQTSAETLADAAQTAVSAKDEAAAARDEALAIVAGINSGLVEEISALDSPITPIKNTFYHVDTSLAPVIFEMPLINEVKEPFRIVVKKKTGDAHGITFQRSGNDTFNDVAANYTLDTKTTLSVRADDLENTDNWVTTELGGRLANPFVDELVANVDFIPGSSLSVQTSQTISKIETLSIFMNGVQLKPSDVASVVDKTITFLAPVPAGVDTIVIRHTETLEIGTPADDTVSTVKIQDDAITPDKLADTAVIPGEYTNPILTVDQQGRVIDAANGDDGITLATPVDTSANTETEFDFVIPPGTKRIKAMFDEVSTFSDTHIVIRLGTGSVLKTSGYTNLGGYVGNGADNFIYTNGFNIRNGSSVNNFSGVVDLCLMDEATNTWAVSGLLCTTYSTSHEYFYMTAGTVTLSGECDILRLTNAAGTVTFDKGKFNISTE